MTTAPMPAKASGARLIWPANPVRGTSDSATIDSASPYPTASSVRPSSTDGSTNATATRASDPSRTVRHDVSGTELRSGWSRKTVAFSWGTTSSTTNNMSAGTVSLVIQNGSDSS